MATEQLTVPSKKAVRRAGEALRTPSVSNADFEAALQVLSDWRSLYYRPINTIQVLLRKKIKALCIKGSIVAQRLKRTPSIIAKLKRFPDMQLDRMQDIGGIRAVVNSVDEVRRVHESLIKGRHQHCPVLPPKDYISRWISWHSSGLQIRHASTQRTEGDASRGSNSNQTSALLGNRR